MHNLRILNYVNASVESTEVPDLHPSAITWDSAKDVVFCALGPGESIPTVEVKKISTNGEVLDVTAWDVQDDTGDQIRDLKFLSSDDVLCAIFSSGDIVLIREDAEGPGEKIEIVGTIDDGILAAAWSPDEEMLLIATAKNTLLFMTRTFDVLKTCHMKAEDLELSKQVSVGWGKKETQFKGKRAHALRDPTIPEHVDEGKLSPNDNNSVHISWRGDGAYVAVSSVDVGIRRTIRVYSREGDIDSVCEAVDNLQPSLAWQPTGTLIASVQQTEESAQVVFFERNGLRHGEFQLFLSGVSEADANPELQWNSDATVLAVVFRNRVQLWTTKNYHWYLKLEIPLAIAQGPERPLIAWNPERTMSLATLACQTGTTMSLSLAVSRPAALTSASQGSVAVIDGRRLLLTPFRVANVPPPYAHCVIELDSAIRDSSFSPDESSVAILTESSVEVWRYPLRVQSDNKPERIGSLALEKDLFYRRLEYHKAERLVLLADDGSRSHVFCISTEGQPTILARSKLDFIASKLIRRSDQEAMFVESMPRALHELHLSGDDISLSKTSLELAPSRSIVLSTEVFEYDNELIALSLNQAGVLSANKNILAKDCTSFVLSAPYILFTTTQHLLKIVHFDTADALKAPADDPEIDERCRAIERGAKLITVVPSKFAVILQMPRGNLETIYPRGLVLAGIRFSIDENSYRKAFLICRTHRVDLNILYDYRPTEFMQNVDEFVTQINRIDYFDLFVSSLRGEDVTQTVYKDSLAKADNSQPPRLANDPSKVNRVCDAVLASLQKDNSERLQNIITSHVCKIPPDVSAAIEIIDSLRAKSEKQAEEAVEHTCFLVDVKRVYTTALGMYNLEVALLVAQQSQMDPREYLPFLQELGKASILRRKFTIDNFLRLYPTALSHLRELGDFEEFKKYMSLHSLHREALEMYRYDLEKHDEIMKLYGDVLFLQSKWQEAAACAEYLQDYPRAVECYRNCPKWQEALFCAKLIPLPQQEMRELAVRLLETLKETKQFSQAASLQMDYLQDFEGACTSFCKGYQFAEALRVASLQSKTAKLIETVEQGLADGLSTILQLFADCKTQVNAQVPRLADLRVKKAEDELAYLEGSGETDIPDNVSVAPSGVSTSASLFTRYTTKTGTVKTATSHKTSKNVRREERKRARGKKGSIYEEEYLVNSLERLIERINNTHGDVENLIYGLIRRRMLQQARAVRQAFTELVDLLQSIKDEVFGGSEETQVDNQELVNGQRPGGPLGVLHDTIAARARKKEVIIKPVPEKLAMLDI